MGLCWSEALPTVVSIIPQITLVASEHIWSRLGNTHTNTHNGLINARVEKLVAIQANVKLFEPDMELSSTGLDTTDEASVFDIEEVQGEDMEACEKNFFFASLFFFFLG